MWWNVVLVYAGWVVTDWVLGKPFNHSLLVFSVTLCLVDLLNKQIFNRKG